MYPTTTFEDELTLAQSFDVLNGPTDMATLSGTLIVSAQIIGVAGDGPNAATAKAFVNFLNRTYPGLSQEV